MKVGYFFRNGDHKNLDTRFVDDGNPGTGGRAFMNLSMAYYLSKSGAPYHPVLFAQRNQKLPEGLEAHLADDIFDALKKASEQGVWLFVTDVTVSFSRMNDILNTIEALNLNVIVRLGLLPSSKILHLLSRCKNVVGVVAVENHILDIICDHPVAKKTVVMPNGISLKPYKKPAIPVGKREKVVTYLGSLVPQKGFGRLAKAWPEVLRAIPDVKLQVIGSGHVYGNVTKLGKWGVAAEDFESSQIRPYLSDQQGNIHSSVTFLGVMGKEKSEVLRNSMVGIANPLGETETFCISAVEIQAASTPVIAGAKYGLFDTVQNNKSGFLVKSHTELSARIIELLKNPDQIETVGKAGYEFVSERYDFERVIQKWIGLFDVLTEKNMPLPVEIRGTPNSLHAKLARINVSIKNMKFIGAIWPSILESREFLSKTKKLMKNIVFKK